MTDRIASGVSYASSVGLVFFGMELSDIALIGGLIIGALTYFTNLYYKHQMLKVAKQKGVNISKDDD
jgi:hypothetical protein